MNIINILNNSTEELKKSNIKSASLDSEILLSKTINKDKQYIILNPEENLDHKTTKDFNNLIKRRKKGEPIAYLINEKEFWKETFYVDRNVLIPRPDTEIVVEETLKLSTKKSQLHILDIGTGSGCILLSILKERPKFYGTGIDISNKSINISKYNAKKLNLRNKVKFYNSDVDNFRIGKYDIIVSNPPYIKLLDYKYLKKDIINFEPRKALSGGFDGFSKIKKIINKVAVLIKKNGKFVLEIGFDQKNKTKEMLKEKGFYIEKTIKDYGNNDRCIVSTKI